MAKNNNRKNSKNRIFEVRMQKKLVVLFIMVLLAFAMLIFRIFSITQDNGEEYKKQVLSQQSYDSRELPFKRGTITDAKGTVLADSELVYSVIVDSYQINANEKTSTDENGKTTTTNKTLQPTLDALEAMGVDRKSIEGYIRDNPDSRYYIAKKNLPYADKVAFEQKIADAKASVSNIQKSLKEAQDANDVDKVTQLQKQLETAKTDGEAYSNITGIWFEAAYIRSYPNGTLASNVIGFANNNNEGSFGLEGYYNSILNGTPGREYGYLNDTSNLERTTIEAVGGENLQLTIDANIQSIIEKYLQEFNDQYANTVREGYGANNVGCVIQDVTNGEILGMANYPNYDLSNPYDLSRIVGMPKLDDVDQPTDEYMTAEDVEALSKDTNEQQSRYLNALWRNFCISTYYEPGSVAKPFTLAAGLESGTMTGDESYYCGGYLNVGGWDIYCHNRKGDGILTVNESIERSCNVAMMQMAEQMGMENFCKFQRIFGFGLRTNIDLQDEARTDTLLIPQDRMSVSDLATNSFGQNFDVTMIQMITAFSSLINGGNFWEPHVVKKITDANGATVQNIEPRLLKKTVSESTSEKVREATIEVVKGAWGTGKTARPAGYMIGGKTGTAETLPRGNGEYVVSFMGYAPADDPKIAIYVVVDRANTAPQDDAKYATRIVRKVLTEVLPYLNIYMTEPLTEAEEQEIRELNLTNTFGLGASTVSEIPVEIALNLDTDGDGVNDAVDANGDGVADTPMDTNGDGITDAVDTDGDGVANLYDTDNDGVADADKPKDSVATNKVSDAAIAAQQADQAAGNTAAGTRYWESFAVDEKTGYYIDPATGRLIDPSTGYMFGDATMGTDEKDNKDTAENGETSETNGTSEAAGTAQ